MSEKKDGPEKKPEDDKPGFRVNLPMGGWIRGDGSHLSQLMPSIKWLLIAATLVFLAMKILEELKAT